MKRTANARKVKGVYKPVIVTKNGSQTTTEIVEKSPERFDKHTKNGIIRGNCYAQGATYSTKQEATAAAQAVIDWRVEQLQARKARFIAQRGPYDKSVVYIQAQIDTYY